MDSDLLIALLGDISAKLDTTNGLLRDIESNTSSTDTNTSGVLFLYNKANSNRGEVIG